MRRQLATFLLTALVTAGLSGCYGSFQATRKLHAWNGNVTSNSFVQQLVFWGLNIIPVYPLFGLGDVVIFNLLEFWTGSNPMADSGAVQIVDGKATFESDGRVVTFEPIDERTLRIEVDGMHIGDAETTAEGDLSIADVRTGDTLILTADQVQELRAQFAMAGARL